MEECGEVDETGSRTPAGPTGAKDGRRWLTPPDHVGLGETASSQRSGRNMSNSRRMTNRLESQEVKQ